MATDILYYPDGDRDAGISIKIPTGESELTLKLQPDTDIRVHIRKPNGPWKTELLTTKSKGIIEIKLCKDHKRHSIKAF